MRLMRAAAFLVIAGCTSAPVQQSTEQSAPAKVLADSAQSEAAPGQPAKSKPPTGYTVKTKQGETFYCRKEGMVGTRFKEEFCYTEHQLEELEVRRAEMESDLMQQQKTCTSAACGGN